MAGERVAGVVDEHHLHRAAGERSEIELVMDRGPRAVREPRAVVEGRVGRSAVEGDARVMRVPVT